MRRFLIHLLIVLMLTPGLACGPFMQKAHAMQAMQGCHETGGGKTGKIPGGGSFFFKDCMKADLHGADHAGVKAPDFEHQAFVVPVAASADFSVWPHEEKNRGPPPDWPAVSQTQPSILLTTLRLRH